jgi:Bifunctional DNA primase/polymerase, N-terminal
VICGEVSGCFEIDIDGNGGRERFEEIFPNLNPNLQSAIKNTMRVVSPNGLKIIFKFRSDEWPEGIDAIKDLWKGQGKHNRIELLGNGCYSLGVGSVHQDRPVYSLAQGSEFNPLTLMKTEIEELVDTIIGHEHSFASERLKNPHTDISSSNDEIIPLAPIDDDIINKLAANAKKYYVEGCRNDFTLGLGGTLRKMGFG